MLRLQNGRSTFGSLCDLGYASVIFSARNCGFVPAPTCGDLTPASSSYPCRVGSRRRWCIRPSVMWHCGNSYRLSASAGAATAEQPAQVRLAHALRSWLRLGYLLGTQLRVVSAPTCDDLTSSPAPPVQGRVEETVVHTVLSSVALRQQLQALHERWCCDGRAACTRSACSATLAAPRSFSRHATAVSCPSPPATTSRHLLARTRAGPG